MNPIIELMNKRKSVRAFEEKEIPESLKEEIIKATLRAPTAGNMMLYSIIEVKDQNIKEKLIKTCDDQPFIGKAPYVLLFLADYQRWYDYYIHSDVEELCKERNSPLRKPEEGDLLLACCDALIAAQTAVLAAESLGIGSCYIGDIMENYEVHKEMFNLPEYVFPITMVCFGYPTQQQKDREQPERFGKEYIVFEDQYKRLNGDEFQKMYQQTQETRFKHEKYMENAKNIGQHMYLKKFSADFSKEMSRSVREALKNWR